CRKRRSSDAPAASSYTGPGMQTAETACPDARRCAMTLQVVIAPPPESGFGTFAQTTAVLTESVLLVLDRLGDGQPRVPARFPRGDPRRRERRIGERADRDGDAGRRLGPPEDRRSAVGAEVERPSLAEVRAPGVLAGAAADRDPLLRPARLEAEGAAGPPLARDAVADRDPERVALDRHAELAAAAGGLAGLHGLDARGLRSPRPAAAPTYPGRMERRIVGFHQDEQGEWVAELACGHRRHVRHRPPFQLRPWVVDAVSRRERLGTLLDCGLCDQRLPEGGEAACFAHLVCPDCGVVLDGSPHRPGCSPG